MQMRIDVRREKVAMNSFLLFLSRSCVWDIAFIALVKIFSKKVVFFFQPHGRFRVDEASCCSCSIHSMDSFAFA